MVVLPESVSLTGIWKSSLSRSALFLAMVHQRYSRTPTDGCVVVHPSGSGSVTLRVGETLVEPFFAYLYS